MARILVVDDEAAVRRLITIVLSDEGHDVETACDGAEALSRIETAIPDLVILDLAMPGMDGWLVLEELHRRGIRSSTRVLIVSGQLDEKAYARAHDSAVSSVLPKPFDIDELARTVARTLGHEAGALYERRDRTDELVRLIEKMEQVLS